MQKSRRNPKRSKAKTTRAKTTKKAPKTKPLTATELKIALALAGQKKISPAIKKKVDRIVKQKGIPRAAAVTFVYYGGPRSDM